MSLLNIATVPAPAVASDATVYDAVRAMTATSSGAVAVTEGDSSGG